MEDDDVPQLSAETFAALQEFYKEQEVREERLVASPSNAGDVNLEENWQLSQFWYDDQTVDTLCKIAKQSVRAGEKVALISCPTLYKTFKKEIGDTCTVHLYEYDERFTIFGSDFILYDYNNPLRLPREYVNYYDLVIADPPFLSDECLTKTCTTIKYIGKGKYILCTGAIMSELADRLLGLKKTRFEPHHRNNLANEFNCFSNYDIDSLL